jgi:hypothetical protein
MGTNQNQGQLIFSRTFWPVEVAVIEFRDGDSRPRHSLKLSRSFRRKGATEWERSTIFLPLTDVLSARQLLADGFSASQQRLQAVYDERRADAGAEVDELAEEITF